MGLGVDHGAAREGQPHRGLVQQDVDLAVHVLLAGTVDVVDDPARRRRDGERVGGEGRLPGAAEGHQHAAHVRAQRRIGGGCEDQLAHGVRAPFGGQLRRGGHPPREQQHPEAAHQRGDHEKAQAPAHPAGEVLDPAERLLDQAGVEQ